MRNGIFILLVLLVVSCKRNYDAPCRDSYIYYHDLNTAQLAVWPFVSMDTLYYIDEFGDSLTFRCNQVNRWYTYVAIPNNPECANDSNAYENRSIPFTCSQIFKSFYTDIQQLENIVSITGQNHNQYWEYGIPALMNSDSATFDSLSFYGYSFKHIYVAIAANGDSMYYSPTHGMVRLQSSNKTLTKWQVKK